MGRSGAGARAAVVAGLLGQLWASEAARAQTGPAGPIVTEVRVEQEGRVVTDRLVLDLIDTRVGRPRVMREVRESIVHLSSLNRYEDIRVTEAPVAGEGVRLVFQLVPVHVVDRVELRGDLGLPADVVRRAITDRFGVAPTAARLEDVRRGVLTLYRDRGFPGARVDASVVEFHDPDRASIIVEVEAGRRAVIAVVDTGSVDEATRAELAAQGDLRVGEPYDAGAVQRSLARYESDLRARGYYEARATHVATFEAGGGARIALTVRRGPRVSIAFTGDPVPEKERERLVPARAEASVDEDLLEDSSRAIENYFRSRGYRDAKVVYTRREETDALTITFDVRRGAHYTLDRVTVAGHAALSTVELTQVVGLRAGTSFEQSMLDSGVAAVRSAYRVRGFTKVDVRPAVETVGETAGNDAERHVEVRIAVVEGPRTLVGAVTTDGGLVMSGAEVRSLITTVQGRPFSEAAVAADRDRLELEYRNRGYDAVSITPRITLAENGTRADVQFGIVEGPQALVDHVIILGNRRISTATIAREVRLAPGQPLGYASLLDSQQRLAALGLFRRVQITQIPHAGETRRDVLVQVDEAPPNTVGYGGGVEGGTRLRPTGDNGQAQERFEVAPRGFFEAGRRNLWGKNRSVNLFTRVSLRSRDSVPSDLVPQPGQPATTSSYGFNEYRVFATFREPRIFNSPADMLVTGILDQAIRSSFNFIRREIRAEAAVRLPRGYSLAGRYSFERTRLFDEHISQQDQPLIDRLFPKVRLSKVSGSLIRDTRDDLLYPTHGTLSVVDGALAARAFGSEVGFAKAFVQQFVYLALPSARRTVLALGGRVGAAQLFALRSTSAVSAGDPVLLPASERFFAGGDTTVRGFSLDRLGVKETISAAGFPIGGNGEIVLNAEVRMAVWQNRAEVVGFVDAGNVFLRATDLSVTNLRSAAGVGMRYRSPVGPIRADVGFNLKPREISPAQFQGGVQVSDALKERGWVLHISLGQAF